MAIYIKVHQKTHRVELLLEFLVGIVDAELLKAVHLKRLKPDENHRHLLIQVNKTNNSR